METPVQAVTFDVGGTLIEPWPSVGRIYADMAERHGWPGLAAETLDRQFAGAWRALRNFGYTREEWAGLVDATFRGLIGTPPSRTFFPELYDYFAEAGAWRIFEDVVPALKALRGRKLKLGVISNWDERLVPLLRRLELYDCFDAVTVSCDAGVTKPSPVIFARAARELGLPPGAILHVGDSAAMDVAGARGAGMRAVRVHRGAANRTRPEAVINSLSPPEGRARPADSSCVVPFEGGGEGNRVRASMTSSPRPSPPSGEEREQSKAAAGAPSGTATDSASEPKPSYGSAGENRVGKPSASSPRPSPPSGEEREESASAPRGASTKIVPGEINSLYRLEEILDSSNTS